MHLNEFIEKAPIAIDAFKHATLVQHAQDPVAFPLDLEEWEWWSEMAAYAKYVECFGDMDPEDVDRLMGDSDGPDGS